MKLLHIDSKHFRRSVGQPATYGEYCRPPEADHTGSRNHLSRSGDSTGPAPVAHHPIRQDEALYEAGALAGDKVEMLAGAVQGGAKVDASTQAEFAETNVVLDEFLAADIVVLGAPMYNFGIPSQLKAWIDCPCRAPARRLNTPRPAWRVSRAVRS